MSKNDVFVEQSFQASLEQKAESDYKHEVITKASLRCVPLILALYIVNYLDRTNIAFAKLTMTARLGMDPAKYGFAVGIFFIGYLLFQVPSNLALHRFGSRRGLAVILFLWGVIATLTAFIQNIVELNVLRFGLGLAEAGFFPGVIMYLTNWFPRRERARIISLCMIAVPISSVIGAPLSTALMQYGHGVLFGLDGWRFMFLIEGIPAILLAFIALAYLTATPEQAKWLMPHERAWLRNILEKEREETSKQFNWSLKRVLIDVRTLCLGFIAFGLLYGLYAVSFFLPAIVADFSRTFGTKFTLFEIGLVVAIPYTVGTVAMVLWSRHADRTGDLIWHVAVPMALGGISIPVALYMSSPFTAMAAITITLMGVLVALPVFWAMPSAYLFGSALAAGLAAINTIGQISGFVGPFVTGWLANLTGTNRAGMWVIGIIMVTAAVMTVVIGAKPRTNIRGTAVGRSSD
jgi:MFS family permease